MRNRIIGVVLGLAIAACILIWQTNGRRSAGWDLLPENEGAISAVEIQYSRDAAKFILPCYRAFLTQLDPATEIIAVCGDESEARDFRNAVSSWGIADSERIHTVAVGRQITGWAKDRFLIGHSRRSSFLICPLASDTGLATRTHDALVAPALARAYSGRFHSVHAPIHFDAGDILATHTRVIVSDVLWRKNDNSPELGQQLEEMFGRRVIRLCGVPDHHIGMYAAPLDEHTVIVGDPKLAQAFWTNQMESSLGHADFSDRTTAPFELAAQQLRRAGFRVVRAPLIVLGPQIYVTYTNGVFETHGSRKIAFMPWYDEPALDRAGRKAYESVGWEVRPIPVRTVFRFRGTIGCLVNVLERK